MKLHELGAQRPTEQVAKTLRAFMGDRVRFDRLSEDQARHMLGRVKNLLKEYKTSVSRHYSERNPDYLRLIMLEQALAARIDEKYMGFEKTVKAIKKGGSARDPEAVAAAVGRKKYGKEKFQKAAAAGKKLGEGRRRLREASDVQQAQVVMAAQDMVDQVQKMMEQISSMQFKDLPALVDAVKNEVGVDQANRFQADATAALGSLLTAVQGGKTQLEAAQGVLTGQAPTVPGSDMAAGAPAPAGDMEAGGDIEADLDLDANLPPEEDEEEPPTVGLGRERR